MEIEGVVEEVWGSCGWSGQGSNQAASTGNKLETKKSGSASIIRRGENLMKKEDTIMRLGKERRWMLALITL
jgi:hypothetical protein